MSQETKHLNATPEKALWYETYEVLNTCHKTSFLNNIYNSFKWFIEFGFLNSFADYTFQHPLEISDNYFGSVSALVRIKEYYDIPYNTLIEYAVSRQGNYHGFQAIIQIGLASFIMNQMLSFSQSFYNASFYLNYIKVLYEYFNDYKIFTFDLIEETETPYGTYLKSSNEDSSKGFYIVIQGDDSKNALLQSSYLVNILLKRGYDVINIDSKKSHEYNMSEIYKIFEQYIIDSRLEGLIINAHGSSTEQGMSLPTFSKLDSFQQCQTLGEKYKYFHSFSFSKPDFIDLPNKLLTTDIVKDLYDSFKSFLSESFEFDLLSCRSAAFNVEHLLKIIPEAKCFFAAAKLIGQDMTTLPSYKFHEYIKTFLLSDQKECLVTNIMHELYNEEMVYSLDYEHQYFNSFDES